MKKKHRAYPISQAFDDKPLASNGSTHDEGLTFREMRRQFIPCPKRLHRATLRRLLREQHRILRMLKELPSRRTWPVVRKRLRTEFHNRLYRIRRRLGLRVRGPRPRQWYRTSAAAAFAGVSGKHCSGGPVRAASHASAPRGASGNGSTGVATWCD